MAAPNTPAARIPRQYTSIPRTPVLPHSSGGGGTPRAGGGHNPLTAGAGSEDQIAPYQQAPITGLPSLLLHPLIQSMYDETTDRTNAARQKHAADKQADTQAALDSYQQSVTAAGGDPHRGLLNWAQTPEGHTAIGKNLMNSVIQLHSVMSSPDPNGQPRSIDVGNGLTELATPDGKYHVFTPKQLEPSKEGKPEKPIMVGKQAYSRDPNDPNNLIPMTVGGREQAPPAAPVKVTPKAISDQIKDIDTILGSSQKMMANIGATGSLGTGSF